jgi:hypothetical protein
VLLADAGVYLTFLASVGYQLSGIEQAVADGQPWQPGAPLTEILTSESEEPDILHDAQSDDQDVPQDVEGGQDVPHESNSDTSQDRSGSGAAASMWFMVCWQRRRSSSFSR